MGSPYMITVQTATTHAATRDNIVQGEPEKADNKSQSTWDDVNVTEEWCTPI